MTERNLDCIACGNCCVSSCDHKVGNLCNAHPSIIGKAEAERLRGWDCGTGCKGVTTWGFLCPPVADAFYEETGIRLSPLPYDGAVMIKEFLDPFITPKLRQFLGLPKHSGY